MDIFMIVHEYIFALAHIFALFPDTWSIGDPLGLVRIFGDGHVETGIAFNAIVYGH